MHRRNFLKSTAASLGSLAFRTGSTGPGGWAAAELKEALRLRGALMPPITFDLRPGIAESFTISGTQITAADERGLNYALLELAARVRHAARPLEAFQLTQPVSGKPANPVRAVSRLFCSDVEDKPWFYDRAMWPEYFAMLARNRFNRFHLAFGIGYDFLRDVTDAYFLFFYPFVVDAPGYRVRASGVSDAERDRNLETLKYISDQAAEHGLDFQLGIWMHGYQWINSPHPNHVIEGLTADTHGPYCRDALAMVLKACPKITGVTFRVHGESGVPEGSYGFWRTVFEGVQKAGRKIEIDMHPKGVDQQMIEVGLATGMPVKLSPKWWAEHMGMPYHQADIRDQEVPHGRTAQGLMALSSGSRSFTRYGYADLLREDRKYGVIHRIWPGTHRLLLWGDPLTAAAASRAFSFCGSEGVDLMEPLSFMGRRGSGKPGSRCSYAAPALTPKWDWQKFQYTYQVWGRMMYDPADAEGARRGMEPGPAAALASTSRILPIITTAHLPSAANNTFWPEIYTNQPIVDEKRANPYTDTPKPKVFGNPSPLDPQLFSSVNEFADELLKGERSGKYSPLEVARWLEDLAVQGTTEPAPRDRRLAHDIVIQAGIGRFFADKLRAAVLYRLYERTGDRTALEEAIRAYERARSRWSAMANDVKDVYIADITAGEHPWLRGNWSDRLEAIDGDIADMRKKLDAAKPDQPPSDLASLITQVKGNPKRASGECTHTAPSGFRAGKAVELSVAAGAPAKLWYRRVTQAERWKSMEMAAEGRRYRAEIPAGYADSPYPLQYYFELRRSPTEAWLYPGFGDDLAGQPYFVLRKG